MQRFFNASEGATANRNAIGNAYRHILGRQPDPGGLNAMTNLANSSGLSAVVDRIINQQEYTQTFGDWGVPWFRRPEVLRQRQQHGLDVADQQRQFSADAVRRPRPQSQRHDREE